jgi:Ca-activated chloride channel homolog
MQNHKPEARREKTKPVRGAGHGGWMADLEARTGRSILGTPRQPTGVVCIALDCSGSMSGAPLQEAREGVIDFSESAFRKGYAISLVAFADDARSLLATTTDIAEVRRAIADLRAFGGTNMAAGLKRARAIVGSTSPRVICLATDGYPSQPDRVVQIAAQIRADGVDIMAVGTESADRRFLARLVSRQELAVQVVGFHAGIRSMSKLLPPRP